MTAATLTIADFLLARIADDEAVARAEWVDREISHAPEADREALAHALDKTLSRQLEALRFALARLGWVILGAVPVIGHRALKARSSQYADHADFDSRWAL